MIANKGILFLGSPCVHGLYNPVLKVCEHYLTNHFWEFHQICNLRAVGDKDELIRFWGQMFKSKKHFGNFEGRSSNIKVRDWLSGRSILVNVCNLEII